MNDRPKAKAWGDYTLFSLSNGLGSEVEITDLGACIINFWVADKQHKRVNIVLGYDTPKQYLEGNVFLGAVVGPWANRVKNGQFILDGKTHQLERNEGDNHLHGASANVGDKRWKLVEHTQNKLTLSTHIDEGEAGFPAAIQCQVTYTLTEDNCLDISYLAKANKRTPINLTQHSYFNLSQTSTILDHHIALASNHYLHVDEQSIPIEKRSVDDTPMDLRENKRIGTVIPNNYQQLQSAKGFDHCYLLEGNIDTPVASVYSEDTGIELNLFTDQKGVQFYSGNFLNNVEGRNGQTYHPHSGFCLETQHYPDQVNMDSAEECIYGEGRDYTHRVIYKISIA